MESLAKSDRKKLLEQYGYKRNSTKTLKTLAKEKKEKDERERKRQAQDADIKAGGRLI